MIQNHGKRFKMSAAGKSVRRRLNDLALSVDMESNVLHLHPETVEAETRRDGVGDFRPDGREDTRTPPGELGTATLDLELAHYLVDYLPKDIFLPFNFNGRKISQGRSFVGP